MPDGASTLYRLLRRALLADALHHRRSKARAPAHAAWLAASRGQLSGLRTAYRRTREAQAWNAWGARR